MPNDPEAAINAIMAAILKKRITQKRVDESVMRILTAKARIGLAAKRLVDIDDISSVVDSPESNSVAQGIADRVGDSGEERRQFPAPEVAGLDGVFPARRRA